MPFDPAILKKILIVILLIAGAFVGYQLVTDSEVEEVKVISESVDVDESYYADESLDDKDMFKKPEYEVEPDTVFELNFAHTVPGEFSNIFVYGSGFVPGEKVIVYLKRTGSDEYEPGGHEVFVDKEGFINTKFTIYSYGSYDVEMLYSSKGNFVETIEVK